MSDNKVFLESVKAFLSESRKKLEAGLSPQQKAHKRNVEAAGGASPEFGAMLRGEKAKLAKRTRGVSGRALDPRFAFTRGEYSKGPKGTMSDKAKSGLAAQLAVGGSSKKVKSAANEKWKKLNTSTEIDLVGAFIQRVLESSHLGNRGKLDVDKDGKIEASDLAALRKGKKKKMKPPMKKKK